MPFQILLAVSVSKVVTVTKEESKGERCLKKEKKIHFRYLLQQKLDRVRNPLGYVQKNEPSLSGFGFQYFQILGLYYCHFFPTPPLPFIDYHL